MNCKKGDLAVVVISAAGNEGKIVTCVQLHRSKRVYGRFHAETGPAWELDQSLMGWDGLPAFFCLDYQLRPIRDQPGADETLTWVRKPVAKDLVRA